MAIRRVVRAKKLSLPDLSPFVVAAYIEEIQHRLAKPTVKQHLAAVRMLFDWLVTGQIVRVNPALCPGSHPCGQDWQDAGAHCRGSAYLA